MSFIFFTFQNKRPEILLHKGISKKEEGKTGVFCTTDSLCPYNYVINLIIQDSSIAEVIHLSSTIYKTHRQTSINHGRLLSFKLNNQNYDNFDATFLMLPLWH